MTHSSYTKNNDHGGASKEASHHWWMQRLSAIALLILSIWFVGNIAFSSDAGTLSHWFLSPYKSIGLLLFIFAALYHGALGMQVVFEDYIHCKCARFTMIYAVKAISIILALALLFAVISAHVSSRQTHNTQSFQRAAVEKPIKAIE
jgi:succinate dehydrogenase / fumarate reductase membrane anchor subunit